MVAVVQSNSGCNAQEPQHNRFLAVLPQIRRQALMAFRKFSSEAREELVQEVVANSFRAWVLLAPRQGIGGLRHALSSIRDPPSPGWTPGRQPPERPGYIVCRRQQVTRFQGRAVRSKGPVDWRLEGTAGGGSSGWPGRDCGGALGSDRMVAHAVGAKPQDRQGAVDGRDDR